MYIQIRILQNKYYKGLSETQVDFLIVRQLTIVKPIEVGFYSTIMRTPIPGSNFHSFLGVKKEDFSYIIYSKKSMSHC